MKLLRYGPEGAERPGLLDGAGKIRDLSDHLDDVAGEALLPDSLKRLAALDPDTLRRVEGCQRIGPCVGRVGKFICIGLNYSDHAAESGMSAPTEPILFFKRPARSAALGRPDEGPH